jgi:HEAT repeat protein
MRHCFVCCLATAALAGCGSPAPSDAPVPVVTAIRSARSPERIHAINDAAHRHRGEAASLARLLADEDPQVRLAAAYVAALWTDDAGDVETLAPLLNDRDEAIRAMVAGSLAGLGHGGAREALAALSGSSAGMPFSDPPLTVGRFSSDALAAIDRGGAPR